MRVLTPEGSYVMSNKDKAFIRSRVARCLMRGKTCLTEKKSIEKRAFVNAKCLSQSAAKMKRVFFFFVLNITLTKKKNTKGKITDQILPRCRQKELPCCLIRDQKSEKTEATRRG